MSLRRAFGAFTFVLFVVTSWAVYANVLSDDSELVRHAGELARARACGGKCNPTRMQGERGMLEERIAYEFSAGEVVVTCRRKAIFFGEYGCEASGPSR